MAEAIEQGVAFMPGEPFYPGTPALTSTTYSAGPFSDAGIQIVATSGGSGGHSVPLPPAVWGGLMLLFAMSGFWQVRRRLVPAPAFPGYHRG